MESRCRWMLSSGVSRKDFDEEWWRWHVKGVSFAAVVVVVRTHDRLATPSSSSHSSLDEAWVLCSEVACASNHAGTHAVHVLTAARVA